MMAQGLVMRVGVVDVYESGVNGCRTACQSTFMPTHRHQQQVASSERDRNGDERLSQARTIPESGLHTQPDVL